MKSMTINYVAGVPSAEGWRGVAITARAVEVAPGQARVIEVEAIDGRCPFEERQRFDGLAVALREEGAVRAVSA